MTGAGNFSVFFLLLSRFTAFWSWYLETNILPCWHKREREKKKAHLEHRAAVGCTSRELRRNLSGTPLSTHGWPSPAGSRRGRERAGGRKERAEEGRQNNSSRCWLEEEPSKMTDPTPVQYYLKVNISRSEVNLGESQREPTKLQEHPIGQLSKQTQSTGTVVGKPIWFWLRNLFCFGQLPPDGSLPSAAQRKSWINPERPSKCAFEGRFCHNACKVRSSIPGSWITLQTPTGNLKCASVACTLHYPTTLCVLLLLQLFKNSNIYWQLGH